MKKKTSNKGPPVIDTYETEIEYMCPVRGMVKQKVKVKRIDSVDPSLASEILPNNSITEKLDRKFSGLDLSDNSLDETEEDIL